MTRARETSENARQAKAWVNFQDGGTITNSFNVSSVTEAASPLTAGYFTVNFENAMPDSNYITLITQTDNQWGNKTALHYTHATYYTANSFVIVSIEGQQNAIATSPVATMAVCFHD